jgi:acyl-CoA synthetase (AMP-forming)/AMP-acid ligase II
MNPVKIFDSIFQATPQRLAIVEPSGRSIRYGDLWPRITGLARHLQQAGLQSGDRVVLQIPNGIEFATSVLAVLLAGGVPILLEPGLGDEVYLSRLRAAKASWLLVHPLIVWINRLPGVARLLQRFELDVPPTPPSTDRLNRLVVSRAFLDQQQQAEMTHDQPFSPVERDPAEDGILVFTGGTTNMPKGVRLSLGAIDAYIGNIATVLTGLTFENFLADTPQQVLYALRLGKTAYSTKGRKHKRATYVRQLIATGRIDAYFGSPYIWMEMMAQTGPNRQMLPASLQTVLLGSAPVTPDFLEQLRRWLDPSTKIMILYGLTEVGPVCSIRAEEKIAYRGPGDLVGRPLANVTIEIRDPDPSSRAGEVVVKSPSLASGYLGEAARSAEDGLQTGDLGRLETLGGSEMLLLLGRKKDMIIRHGVNIYPASFEAGIKALKDERGNYLLRECAMVGLWDPQRQDESLLLCFQPLAGVEIDLAAFKSLVEAFCGSDAKPDHYLMVDPIPVSGRQNKIDKNALRQQAAAALGWNKKMMN